MHYKKLEEVGESVFQCLKKKDTDELEKMNAVQNEYIRKVDIQMKSLRDVVVTCCQEKGIADYKLSQLLVTATQEEKEQILQCQQETFQYEQSIRQTAMFCQDLIKPNIKKSQDIIDAWIHVSQGEEQKPSLIDRKL